MAKKTIHLTENELKQMIYEAVMPMLSEIDAKTYTRVNNFTNYWCPLKLFIAKEMAFNRRLYVFVSSFLQK